MKRSIAVGAAYLVLLSMPASSGVLGQAPNQPVIWAAILFTAFLLAAQTGLG
jgi:hypothetical protein